MEEASLAKLGKKKAEVAFWSRIGFPWEVDGMKAHLQQWNPSMSIQTDLKLDLKRPSMFPSRM